MNPGDGSGQSSSFVPSRHGALSTRVLAARQYFLYGDENGNRILDPKQLADKVGCHVGSIFRHVASWSDEHERMLMRRNDCEWKIALTEQTLKRYKEDVGFLERQADEIKGEIEAHGRVEAFLDELLRKFDFGKGDAKEAVSAIQTYLQTVGSKKFLREHWMKVEKMWIEISGMQSRISVAETFEKEIAKDAARRKGKSVADDGAGRTPAGAGGFFDF